MTIFLPFLAPLFPPPPLALLVPILLVPILSATSSAVKLNALSLAWMSCAISSGFVDPPALALALELELVLLL